MLLKSILCPIDFSDFSAAAYQHALSLGEYYKARVVALHVSETATDLARAEAVIAERTQELDKLVSETERKNLNVRSAVRFGKPYEEIVRHATEMHAGLIIMTARGGDTMDRAVFGSTTYRVIQFGPCPVLAIHT